VRQPCRQAIQDPPPKPSKLCNGWSQGTTRSAGRIQHVKIRTATAARRYCQGLWCERNRYIMLRVAAALVSAHGAGSGTYGVVSTAMSASINKLLTLL
jgi:hypothetical protein